MRRSLHPRRSVLLRAAPPPRRPRRAGAQGRRSSPPRSRPARTSPLPVERIASFVGSMPARANATAHADALRPRAQAPGRAALAPAEGGGLRRLGARAPQRRRLRLHQARHRPAGARQLPRARALPLAGRRRHHASSARTPYPRLPAARPAPEPRPRRADRDARRPAGPRGLHARRAQHRPLGGEPVQRDRGAGQRRGRAARGGRAACRGGRRAGLRPALRDRRARRRRSPRRGVRGARQRVRAGSARSCSDERPEHARTLGRLEAL